MQMPGLKYSPILTTWVVYLYQTNTELQLFESQQAQAPGAQSVQVYMAAVGSSHNMQVSVCGCSLDQGHLVAARMTCSAKFQSASVFQVFGTPLGISPVVAAILAVALLLFTGVLSWSDCLNCTQAWDTLFWFSGKCVVCCQLTAIAVINDAVFTGIA